MRYGYVFYISEFIGNLLTLAIMLPFKLFEAFFKMCWYALRGRNPNTPILYDMFWDNYRKAKKRGWKIL